MKPHGVLNGRSPIPSLGSPRARPRVPLRPEQHPARRWPMALVRSGAVDEIVTIDPPQGADTNWQPLRVRLLRIDGRDGPAFYATSLTDSDVSIEDIAYLYHLRWESEEFFKLFTSNYAGQGQFRSRTPSGVRQEIGALTLLLAMSRVLATAVDEAALSSDKFVSQKGAVLSLRYHLLAILLGEDERLILASIQRAMSRMLRTLDHRRPGRSYPRRSLRPRPKRGPKGHVGA